MKIAHLIFGLGLGGIETMLVNIANEQIKYASVTIIIINDCINKELLRKFHSQIEVIRMNRHRSIWPLIKLNRLLIKRKFDIVHVQSKELGLVLLTYFIRSKFVYTIHDTGVALKYINCPYDLRISISECVREDVKIRTGIDSIAISNGIKVTDFRCKIREMTNKASVFKIIQLSRIALPKKGQHILIEALSILKKRGITNILCTFIGEGDSSGLESLVSKYGLSNVLFLGARDQSYIQEHLNEYDLVQPSMFEGFGITVTEGMAVKIPVLVSNIEGPMEIINKGEYGYFFEVGNAEDCAIQIEKIMSSDNVQLVNSAYKRVCQIYNIETTAKRYIEEYKKII